MVQYAFKNEIPAASVQVLETTGPWPMRIESRDDGRRVIASLDYFCTTGKKKGDAFYVVTRHISELGGENETVADVCIDKDFVGQPKQIMKQCLEALDGVLPDPNIVAVEELLGGRRGNDRSALYAPNPSWSEKYYKGWRAGRSHKYNPNRSKI